MKKFKPPYIFDETETEPILTAIQDANEPFRLWEENLKAFQNYWKTPNYTFDWDVDKPKIEDVKEDCAPIVFDKLPSFSSSEESIDEIHIDE